MLIETNPELATFLELSDRSLKNTHVGLLTNRNSCEMMEDCGKDINPHKIHTKYLSRIYVHRYRLKAGMYIIYRHIKRCIDIWTDC